MKLRKIIGICTLALMTGCVSIDPYYSDVPTEGAELVDGEVASSAERGYEKSADELILKREAEDYLLVGRADFVAPAEQDWVGAMVRKGEEIKAAKIDYFTWYVRTDTATGMMSVPTMHTSTGTVWGPHGPRTVTMTSMDSTWMPYSYPVPQNEYHVFYFRKLSSPFRLGVHLDEPDDETAKKVGTRNALVITAVVPRKLAWEAGFFKGDVILAIDGKAPTRESVKALGRDPYGKLLKFWRDGKVHEKVLEGHR